MRDRIQKLGDMVDPAEKHVLAVLIDTETLARQQCSKAPTEENNQALEIAAQGLERVVNWLWGKHYPTARVFKDRMAVLRFLKAEGYVKQRTGKLGRQTVYNDANNGLLKLQSDGTILEEDVRRYIKRAELIRKEDTRPQEIDKDQQLKAVAERKKSEALAKLYETKAAQKAGELIELATVEGLLVDRIVEFKKAHLSQGRRLSLRLANKTARECQKVLDVDNRSILAAYARETPFTPDMDPQRLGAAS